MRILELSFIPTLDNAQRATIAVRQIVETLIKTVKFAETTFGYVLDICAMLKRKYSDEFDVEDELD